MWPFGRKKSDKKFFAYGVHELREQLRLAEAYEDFLAVAALRGFAIEVIVIVDGQFSTSSIMVQRGSDSFAGQTIDFLHSVAQGEVKRIRKQLAEWDGVTSMLLRPIMPAVNANTWSDKDLTNKLGGDDMPY